jgi:hypothetical protein
LDQPPVWGSTQESSVRGSTRSPRCRGGNKFRIRALRFGLQSLPHRFLNNSNTSLNSILCRNFGASCNSVGAPDSECPILKTYPRSFWFAVIQFRDGSRSERHWYRLVWSMPSTSYWNWKTTRSLALDEIESAHSSVGGTGPGRRYATQQINQAYAVLVASQFQGFCRDLHTESVTHLVNSISPLTLLLPLFQARFIQGRQLDSKNAQPGSIGADFGNLGVQFWDSVLNHHLKNKERKNILELINKWRNAIAHQNFSDVSPNMTPKLTLKKVRCWRSVCKNLAISFDVIMRLHLVSLTLTSPWPE